MTNPVTNIDPNDRDARSRLVAGNQAAGECAWYPDTQTLVAGLSPHTWDLLIGDDERRQVSTANLEAMTGRNTASDEPRASRVRDAERTTDISYLLHDALTHRSDAVAVRVRLTTAPIFEDLFRKLLVKARAGDTIETKAATTRFNPWTEKDEPVAALTTPSAPVLAELEAILEVAPHFDIDTKQVAA